MEMEFPAPWDSPTAANAADRNYDIKSPLKPDGSDFPCKGLDQASGSVPSSATYQAGQTYNTTIDGYASHNGGSCQLSLSYDNGKTWKVIKSMIGGCPTQGSSSYDFTIPMTAPSGTALFAWTWINHTGNREFYMNCAVVDIEGKDGGDLCMLPNLYVANLDGINSCVSPEGIDTMFPHPGADVVYGDGMSASSPVTGGNSCEIPAPACSGSSGNSQSQAPSNSGAAKASMTTAPATRDGAGAQGSGIAQVEIAANTNGPEFSSAVEAYIASVLGASAAAATGAEGAALTSMIESYINSVLHASTAGMTAFPSFPTDLGSTAATESSTTESSSEGSSVTPTFFLTSTITSTGTITATPIANATAVTTDNSLINSFINSVLSGAPQLPSTNATAASNWSASASIPPVPVPLFGEVNAQRLGPTTPNPMSSPSSSPHPPYVTSDPNTALYLPCTPGNFLCSSATSFYTCNQPAPAALAALAPNGWSWAQPRPVAAGMMCLPFARAPNSTETARAGGTVRDDRYVRARPNGDCATDGAVRCTEGGKGFWVCDQGGWVDMGDVAEGTACVAGGIVRAG
ncbi:hypothetical protein SLS56_011610 [Neofusicoccum ribis]|uniref:Lytic polysaccharide monooxygenase n=1 Tax=Neofusicoccum ribis TaxID=45134 RepID=A0ABR3SB79_9PEZI